MRHCRIRYVFLSLLALTLAAASCTGPAIAPASVPSQTSEPAPTPTPTPAPTPTQTPAATPTMTVTPLLRLSGKVGATYSDNLTVSGGTSPYTWSISAGALPDGLSLGSSTSRTNTIGGTPTKAGIFSFSVKVTDSVGGTLTRPCSITITQLTMTPQVVTLKTRPGVTMKVLLLNSSSPPIGTLVMLPGGSGSGGFSEQSGIVRLGLYFNTRTSGFFVEQGFVVAIVDVPSDQTKGITGQFRTSSEHAQDIKNVIDFLSQRQMGPIFLVGTSMSTLSVAYLGVSLGDNRIGGIVLTSSVTSGSLSLFDLPLDTITLPVLIVHHQQDGCQDTKFSDALRLRNQFTRSTRTGFVEVVGGDPPLTRPCEALSYHGFLGREREVVSAITDWVKGKEVADRVGAP